MNNLTVVRKRSSRKSPEEVKSKSKEAFCLMGESWL